MNRNFIIVASAFCLLASITVFAFFQLKNELQAGLKNIQTQNETLQNQLLTETTALKNTVSEKDAIIDQQSAVIKSLEEKIVIIENDKKKGCTGFWYEGACLDPKDGLLQTIRLTSLHEIVSSEGSLQIAGLGGALINGGAGAWFWDSSTPQEITIKLSSKSLNTLAGCNELLSLRKPVEIKGQGIFTGKEEADKSLLGAFVINNALICNEF